MKMLAKGVLLFWEKCQLTIAFAAQKWEMSAVVMGEKMMTVFRKMMTQSVKIVKLKEVI